MHRLAFVRDNARWLGAGFALLFCASFGQTFFIALAGSEIRRELGLSHGAYGALYMAATLAGAWCLPRIGPMADRWPSAQQAGLVLAMLALSALAMAAVVNAVWLFAALLGLRLFGQGLATHTAFTALGRWFSARRGQSVAIATLGMNAGEAMLPSAFVAVTALVGWRGAWAAVAALLLLVALPLVCGLAAMERPAEAPQAKGLLDASHHRTRAQVLRDPLFPLLLLAVLPPALIGNTVFFHQAHLLELRGWPPTLLASAFPLMAGATVLCSLLSGRWVDRFGATALLPWYALPMGAACLLLGASHSAWSAFAFMALYGASNGASLTLFGTLWPQLYGTAHLGAIRSVVVSVLVTVSALGPGLAGLALDAGVGLPPMLLGFGVYCVLVSALMLPVSRRLRTNDPSSARAAQPTR